MPDRQPWLRFFLRALRQQTKRLTAKIDREKSVIANLPELSAQILDHARNHGRVSIGGMIRATGVRRNTLKEHFRSLVEKGHLVRRGAGRGSWRSPP